MSRHLGYSEHDRDVTLQWFVPRRTARRMAWTAATVAAVAGAALGFAAGKALGDSISISGSVVSLDPSDAPGELAVVTFQNLQMNGGHDDGNYPLAIPGLVVEIQFVWEAGIWGEDRVTVIPPEGIACIPENCATTVLEGYTGHVVLIDWRGM